MSGIGSGLAADTTKTRDDVHRQLPFLGQHSELIEQRNLLCARVDSDQERDGDRVELSRVIANLRDLTENPDFREQWAERPPWWNGCP